MEGMDDEAPSNRAFEQNTATCKFSVVASERCCVVSCRADCLSFSFAIIGIVVCVIDWLIICHHCWQILNISSSRCSPSCLVAVKRAVQYWLDKSTIHTVPRWIFFGVVLSLFFLRIYLVQGYFIVAYGLGIFLLNNFIAFLSPLEDPTDNGPGLPSTNREAKEYRPFTRRLPEFKFWLACTQGTGTCLIMTFFSVFDVPVFWPILLMYFFVLFFMTMRRQIMHMYKHRYVPISFGKAKYKDAGVENSMYGGGMSKGN